MRIQQIKGNDLAFIVKDILAYKLGLEDSQLVDSANFQDHLGIDSLDMIELRMELEEKLDISISDEEGEQLRTVGILIHFIEQKIRL